MPVRTAVVDAGYDDLSISIGGVVKTFTLDAKGSLASSLSDEGLVDATVTDLAVTMPVEIKLNGTMYEKACLS